MESKRILRRKRRRPSTVCYWGALLCAGTVEGYEKPKRTCDPPITHRLHRWRCGGSKESGGDSLPKDSVNDARISSLDEEPSLEILSSPFLEDFDREVSTIVSGYRSDVRDTFQKLQRDLLLRQREQQRKQRAATEAEERKRAEQAEQREEEEARKKAERAAKLKPPSDLEPVADSDEDDVEELFGVSEVADETRETLDVFSDLVAAGGDEGEEELLIGDTDEDDDVVMERLLSQKRRKSSGRAAARSVAKKKKTPLDDTAKHSNTKKKKRKSKKRKSKKKKKANASDWLAPPPSSAAKSSATTTAKPAATTPENMLTRQNLTKALSYLFLYVLTALLISLLSRVLKVGG